MVFPGQVMLFIFSMMFGGLVLTGDTGALSAFNHLSFFRYAFESLFTNEFEGLALTFDGVPVSGEAIMLQYGDLLCCSLQLF